MSNAVLRYAVAWAYLVMGTWFFATAVLLNDSSIQYALKPVTVKNAFVDQQGVPESANADRAETTEWLVVICKVCVVSSFEAVC